MSVKFYQRKQFLKENGLNSFNRKLIVGNPTTYVLYKFSTEGLTTKRYTNNTHACQIPITLTLAGELYRNAIKIL